MDNSKQFPQQQAPEKNTDDAYVQVGKNGEPVIPGNTADTKQEETPVAKAQEESSK